MNRSGCRGWLTYGLGVLISMGMAGGVNAADKAPQFIGANSCSKTCHKTAKQGKQKSIWEGSGHAKAFLTLATPEALEIGKAQGIDNPQEADACLKCHVTAHGVSDDLKGAKFTHEEGVGCEVCHGAGSLYKKRKVMKDHDASIAAGLLIPDEKTCLKCHNEESPTYKPFNFEERWEKITHLKLEK